MRRNNELTSRSNGNVIMALSMQFDDVQKHNSTHEFQYYSQVLRSNTEHSEC